MAIDVQQVKERIAVLDGLRGIAIILVIFHHYFCGLIYKPTIWVYLAYKLSEWTWCGVDLFFILSGFLIGGILMDHKNSANLIKVFYCRRAFRILPIYYVVVGIFFLILGLGPYPQNVLKVPYLFDNLIPTWPYLFFLQNIMMAMTRSVGPYFVVVTGLK